MRRIYKYPIELIGFQTVEMPVNAEIISAINQRGTMTLYAMVDPNETVTEQRKILVFGTGHDIPNELNPMKFIATLQDDIYVWHIFEKL